MTHFATKYIGQPYKAGFFDCWGLVRKVYTDEYAINLPAFPVDVDNLRQLIKTVKEKSNSKLKLLEQRSPECTRCSHDQKIY